MGWKTHRRADLDRRPRDQTWEIDNPVFRVYFHDDDGTSYDHEVRDANAVELLAWVRRFAEGRTSVVYVCVPRDGLGSSG